MFLKSVLFNSTLQQIAIHYNGQWDKIHNKIFSFLGARMMTKRNNINMVNVCCTSDI